MTFLKMRWRVKGEPGVCLATYTVAGGTHCSIWGESTWLVPRELSTPRKLKESMFCCLASDSLKRATHKPLEPSTWTWSYQIMGTSKAPNVKYTLTPSLLLPTPFLPQLAFSFLGTCSKLKSKSVPSRETRNMCMSPPSRKAPNYQPTELLESK